MASVSINIPKTKIKIRLTEGLYILVFAGIVQLVIFILIAAHQNSYVSAALEFADIWLFYYAGRLRSGEGPTLKEEKNIQDWGRQHGYIK